MIYIHIRHTVADYNVWRLLFDSHEAFRRAAGSTGVSHVFRSLDNPNDLTILIEWSDAQKARQFLQDPGLADVMKQAGVISQPEVGFLERA